MPDGSMVAFALNHITCCRLDHDGLARLAADLGLAGVELRNDMADGALPADVATTLAAAGQRALSVNALQRFNDWNDDRAAEAEALAAATRASGASALILCPVNAPRYWAGDDERLAALRAALAALKPILDRYGLTGLVEPLGFESSTLRHKHEAIDAIDAIGGATTYRILHDTFHHAIAGEMEFYPEHTGLVHISGVSAPDPAVRDMRDEHRILIDAHDRIDTVGQIAALMQGGYVGLFSIECFAASVHTDPDLATRLAHSIAFMRNELATRTHISFT